jgi:hypothetical protein
MAVQNPISEELEVATARLINEWFVFLNPTPSLRQFDGDLFADETENRTGDECLAAQGCGLAARLSGVT